MENYEEAIPFFEETVQRSGEDNPERRGLAHYNIARCHQRLGHRDEALVHLNHAVELLGPDSVEGREALHLARQLEPGESRAGTTPEVADAPSVSPSEAYNRARRLYEEARTGGFEAAATRQALEAYQEYQREHTPTGERAREVTGRIRMMQQRLVQSGAALADRNAGSDSSAGSTMPLPDPFAEEHTDSSRPASASRSTTTAASRPTASSGATARRTPAASAGSSSGTARASRSSSGSAAQRRSDNSPGFSLVASYQMKNIKRSGKLTYNMNHYRTENQAFAMAENIGALYSRYGHDPRVFRAVTIDDPVFKQREVLVTLDGQDASTFTRHLNFVTVKLRKRHQSGAVTSDEVVITPEKFNAEGNAFSLGYGYKGDDDRAAWLDYQHQTLWSFHGGVEVRSPWNNADSPMLALQPPHRYRSVTFEGEGEALTAAGVRHAVITVSSLINGRKVTQQATIRNKGPVPAAILDIAEDLQQPQVEVQIDWYLTGGRKKSGPVMPLSGDLVYWDEIPGGGA